MTTLNDTLKALPKKPGVYIMKNKKQDVLYVGKAKKLNLRVRSYFNKSSDDRPLIKFLIKEIYDIETIITSTEKEALILENNLIKKYRPKYNIDLRDDKNYPYLVINKKDDFPALKIMRIKHKLNDCIYFGPFVSVFKLKDTLKQINKIFPLRKCSFKKFSSRTRPCLYHQINLCPAPCCNKISKEDYNKILKDAVSFLKGSKGHIIKELKEKMKIASDNLEFEKAAKFRDKIEAISATLEKQNVTNLNTGNKDILAFKYENDTWYFSVLMMRDGKINDTFYYNFKHRITDEHEALTTFISQYYFRDSMDFYPEEIVTASDVADKSILEEIMQERNIPAKIIITKAGHNYRLYEIAHNNLLQEIKIQSQAKDISPLTELQKKLHLSKLPMTIECVDISNISGTDAVGAIVCFKNGKPKKSFYRKYKIKTVDQISDYDMMYEVLYRHFSRKLKENTMPDLLMVDGGKGHLNIALSVTEKLKCSVHLISIAKEKKDKNSGEKIYVPNRQNKINFKITSSALKLLTNIRDETHRFAITFHKHLRDKKITSSSLDNIKGIGKTKKMELLKAFGSVEQIKKASVDELTSIKGITETLAQKIKKEL